MKTLKTLALATAVSTGLLGAGGVLAFEDGTVGDSSTGRFDVRLLIEQKVKAWGFEDVVFTDDNISTPQTSTFCVASNSRRYSLSVGSTNNKFTLGVDDSNNYPYTIKIDGKIVVATKDGTPQTPASYSETWGAGGTTVGDLSPKDFVAATTDTDATTCTDPLTITTTIGTKVGTVDTGAYTDDVIIIVSAR